MPKQPKRHAPGRESTRPGAGRGGRADKRAALDAQPATDGSSGTGQPGADTRSRRIPTLALGMAQRVIAIVATAAVLSVTFVSSFSVYLGQQREIAETKAAIAADQQRIAELQDELTRWQDPAYIKARAREQLGWVMPGEVGYRVVDANGQVIGTTVETPPARADTPPPAWYDTLWSSLQTADQPTPDPAQAKPAGPATVGPDGVETPR